MGGLDGGVCAARRRKVREQMRVLEQKVNGHNDLSPGEQIELQAGVTEVYTALMALVSGLSV